MAQAPTRRGQRGRSHWHAGFDPGFNRSQPDRMSAAHRDTCHADPLVVHIRTREEVRQLSQMVGHDQPEQALTRHQQIGRRLGVVTLVEERLFAPFVLTERLDQHYQIPLPGESQASTLDGRGPAGIAVSGEHQQRGVAARCRLPGCGWYVDPSCRVESRPQMQKSLLDLHTVDRDHPDQASFRRVRRGRWHEVGLPQVLAEFLGVVHERRSGMLGLQSGDFPLSSSLNVPVHHQVRSPTRNHMPGQSGIVGDSVR